MDGSQSKVAELQARIQMQRRMIEGFQTICSATPNPDVIRQAESSIRDAQQTISYLENNLHVLQGRNAAAASQDTATYPVDSSSAYRNGPYAMYSTLPPGAGGPPEPVPGAAEENPRRQQTNLDMIKYNTPLTSARVARMLNQLQLKLQLEKQYKQGFDKMAKLYQAEGDRRSRNDAESRRVESTSKIVLLQQALNRYQQLDIGDGPATDMSTAYEQRRAYRRPQSGTFTISVQRAKDLDHAAQSHWSRSARETFVGLKVEDTERAQTHARSPPVWNEEFSLHVDNASEVELVVYDRVGSAVPVPIGVMWLRISDVVEELRKKKFGQVEETRAEPWVPVSRDGAQSNGARSDSFSELPADSTPGENDSVYTWFTVEPAGALLLRVTFTKQNVQKRPAEGRLGRQGALRKRQEVVAEVNGHKFAARQFYQVIRCALCGELLFNAAGSQCQDCNYTCHRKCAQKVVTTCIGNGKVPDERDELKINHRIPHRFQQFTNLGANWCCHCGSMLALGRRSGLRKCAECDVTAHADCVPMVPDFCGMSMEMANQLLSNIDMINKDRSHRASISGPLSHSPGRSPGRSPARSPARASLPNISAPPSPSALVSGVQNLAVQEQRSPAGNLQPPQAMHPGQSSPRLMPTVPSGRASPLTHPAPAHSVPSSPSATVLSEFSTSVPVQQTQQTQQTLQTPTSPASVGAPPRTPTSATGTAAGSFPPSSGRNVQLNDFNFLAVLGKGNFGKVMLAEEKHTGQLFAIKVLKKEFIIENDEIDSMRSEKRVFLTVAREQHPFLLGLHSTFQTETRIYFVMEYVGGGDLMLHIQREQFNMRRAKFYAAEVLLALEYFHKHGIVYRDLKLDNILLTLEGHIKLADYGLCKENMWHGNTTSTFCGTPEFMAPEILLEQRYTRAVDWWAFGILLYEMLLGQAPFRGDDEDEIFDAILEDEPLYPIQMPRESVSILQQLLTRDPRRRLGAGPADAEEVKKHPFFADVDWDDMLHRRVMPPFLPTLKSAADTSWFDTEVRLYIMLTSLRVKSLLSRPCTVSSRRGTRLSSATLVGHPPMCYRSHAKYSFEFRTKVGRAFSTHRARAAHLLIEQATCPSAY